MFLFSLTVPGEPGPSIRFLKITFNLYFMFIKLLHPRKTKMTGWKIPMFNRKYIFIHGGFSIVNRPFSGEYVLYGCQKTTAVYVFFPLMQELSQAETHQTSQICGSGREAVDPP